MIVDLQLILESTKDTLLMVIVSTIIAYLIGLPIGVLLFYTSKKGLNYWYSSRSIIKYNK